MSHEESLVPCLRTLAMGDSGAVCFGQSAHLNVLLESGAVEARQFVSLTGRPPRSGLIAGLVIDDFILLEVVPSNPGNSDRKGPETMRLVREAYLSAGLPRHPDKSVHGAVASSSAGACFPCWTSSTSLVAKPSPGKFSLCPGALRTNSSSLALLCQCCIDMKTPAAPWIVCSDASDRFEAAAVCKVAPEFSAEAFRHTVQKGLWSKLLVPSSALLRGRGHLEEAEELPGESYSRHPLWEEICRTLPFKPWGAVRKARGHRHTNVGEVRAAIAAEQQLARSCRGVRFVHLQDSQVGIAAMTKGRSSASLLNKELRRSLGFYLGHDLRPGYGYIRSRHNPSDDPTRKVRLRKPESSPPPWLSKALRGQFQDLDAFLTLHDLSLDQLRGFGPAASGAACSAELAPEARHLACEGPGCNSLSNQGPAPSSHPEGNLFDSGVWESEGLNRPRVPDRTDSAPFSTAERFAETGCNSLTDQGPVRSYSASSCSPACPASGPQCQQALPVLSTAFKPDSALGVFSSLCRQFSSSFGALLQHAA